ncbi:MAG: hypothetical protein G8D58_10340 [gamma proteobacterium symbiont of Phacoides pectinatus]
MKPDSKKAKQQESQVLGLRLPVSLVREVKAEAAMRGLRLNQLFVELWDLNKNRINSKCVATS